MNELQEIRDAQQDIKKFEVLYDRYYDDVFKFCYQRSGDYDMAGDLTSRVFIKAMQNLNKYRDKKKAFSSWLFTIAFNEVNDHFRKMARDRTVRIDENRIKAILPPEYEGDDDLKLSIGRVLNKLKPADLNLIELKYFEGRSHDEICEILDISAGNARIRLHRAMEKLRSLFMESIKELKS